jgi:hypothetical protein
MRTTLIIVISVLSAGKGRQVHAANTVLYENEHVSAIARKRLMFSSH